MNVLRSLTAMKLAEWVGKTPRERNRLRRQWVQQNLVKFSPLLEEACEQFRREFSKHPSVLRVGLSLAHHEACINVTTSLWFPERVEELPDRYC
ncbi:MAG TPA: hypothetical protein VG347_12435 [Verrucomicrobiae bacterium]|nr:hypothetical protein [Verrucomicrobiae bacterium]